MFKIKDSFVSLSKVTYITFETLEDNIVKATVYLDSIHNNIQVEYLSIPQHLELIKSLESL